MPSPADGTVLPAIGLGTWPMSDDEAAGAVAGALRLGYRLIDTAAKYGNEAGVGRGLAESGVPRDEVVLTSKLRGADHGYDATKTAVERSCQTLGVDHLDLYLIHWPLPRIDRYVESWRAMIELWDAGVLRSIGVSNFTPAQLDRLVAETGVVPMVNQVELHPYFPQRELRADHAGRDIRVQSWSPLARDAGRLLAEPPVLAAARAHGIAPAQAVLAWHVALGTVAIPKSASQQRQAENLAAVGIELTDTEIAAISALERGRTGGDPDTHEEF